MSRGYSLKEGIVVELQATGSCSLVLPSVRQRLLIGPGVLSLLCEVARQNANGRAAIAEDLGEGTEAAVLLTNLVSLGVLVQDGGATDDHSLGDGLTLLERATLRMAQGGGLYHPRLPSGRQSQPRVRTMASAGPPVLLPEPEMRANVNLWEIIRARRSRRNGPPRTVSSASLSALLSNSLRIQRVAEDNFGEISFRPVASGGARHPIEAFVSVIRVSDVAEGVYQYDPLAHRLSPLSVSRGTAEALTTLALGAMIQQPEILPALTLLFAAVTARTACKYDDSSLVTVMKDVGCLIQQLYLVVEGLTLCGCAIGGADAPVVEEILGLTGTDVTFVGGFVIW